MKPGARISAAIAIVDTILNRYQPVPVALQDWGKANRFAGSGDRNAIGHLVYDALRHKASSGFALGSETPRAYVIGGLREQGVSASDIAELCTGENHTPAPLTEREIKGLELMDTSAAPDWVSGNYPEWLHPSFERAFGGRAVQEGKALSRRAPADLRVNTLKAKHEAVLDVLQEFKAEACTYSPVGIRVPAPKDDARTPNLMAEPGFQTGEFEIQDEGSQIAAALAGATAGMTVLDLCAGGGGKTLAMAAAMGGKGQIYAYDSDRNRLKPMFQRLERAGVRNVQVVRGGDEKALDALGAKFDLVLVDSPCTGTGTWRRRPDAKWRLKPDALAARVREQQKVLARAARHVKPGGRLVYVTCSVLPEENTDQIAAFLAANSKFKIEPFAERWRSVLPSPPPKSADGREDTLLLTPASHGTDGFFIAVLNRQG